MVQELAMVGTRFHLPPHEALKVAGLENHPFWSFAQTVKEMTPEQTAEAMRHTQTA